MTKVVVLIAIIATFYGCAHMSITMENVPKGFRGIEFGENIDALKEINIERQDETISKVTRKDENFEFAGAKVDKIYYYFYKGHFYEGRILFKGMENYHNLRAALHRQHGASLQGKVAVQRAISGALTGTAHLIPESQKEVYSWVSDTVYISLEYISGEGVLSYQFIPILETMK